MSEHAPWSNERLRAAQLALAETIVQLQSENAALRGFVAARDAINVYENTYGSIRPVSDELMALYEVEANCRVRLAERYEVTLP